MKTKGLLLAALTLGVAAQATSITVDNSSFESDLFGLNGWNINVADWDDPGNNSGAWRPNGQFSSIPDGVNVAWARQLAVISQVLGDNLAAGKTYSLSVEVGSRSDGSFGGSAFSVGLYAGGNLLAENTTAIVAGSGSFANRSVVFTPLATDPNLGQTLEIRLASATGSSAQIAFDDVKLDCIGVPEAGSTLLLLGCSLLGVASLRRIRI